MLIPAGGVIQQQFYHHRQPFGVFAGKVLLGQFGARGIEGLHHLLPRVSAPSDEFAEVTHRERRIAPDRLTQHFEPVFVEIGIGVDIAVLGEGDHFLHHPFRRLAFQFQQFAADAVERLGFGRPVPEAPARGGFDEPGAAAPIDPRDGHFNGK